VIGVVEVASALYLASLNPIQGYDENWYLINAHRFVGDSSIPYAVHRPPLLPLLLALFGTQRWLISGLAHIAAAITLAAILRMLAPTRVVLAGVALFVICADVRLYNVLTLTEMPGIFLTLLAILCYLQRRPFSAGGASMLLFMLHWGYLSVIPAFVLVYLVQRRLREGGLYIAGLSLAAVPFLIGFYAMFGDPSPSSGTAPTICGSTCARSRSFRSGCSPAAPWGSRGFWDDRRNGSTAPAAVWSCCCWRSSAPACRCCTSTSRRGFAT